MHRISIGLTLIICCFIQSCDSQTAKNGVEENNTAPLNSEQVLSGSPRFTKIYDSTKIQHYYPFIAYMDGSHLVAAEIESQSLSEKYFPIFEKHQYSGNGYSWEGHIKQMLQKENPSLLKHLRFDPEAGGFYLYADSEKTQKEFAEFASKIFNDIPKLEMYLSSADRGKIDD